MIGSNEACILSLFIILLVSILVFIIIIYNRFISLNNNIKRDWANINVSLKQRSNELPNLINIVKGYMKYEKTTLETITKARSYLNQTEDVNKKAAASEIISESIKSLFAVVENYPDLKAQENFSHLQNRITALENEIADRREYYNECVTIYNIRIKSFPDLIIAKIINANEKRLFQATDEEKKEVKLKF